VLLALPTRLQSKHQSTKALNEIQSMTSTCVEIESDNSKKFKFVLQTFLYENSFYCLDEYFEIKKKVKYIYIRSGLVFESLAHEVHMHVCSFFYLLICIFDLSVYITQPQECTDLL
jgi:hypothetical protein